jgi:hypothetical protein
MTLFEEYLISIGYKRYRQGYDSKTGRVNFVESYSDQFSTMGTCWYAFMINDDLQSQILFGLNEKDRPPTLVFPRPMGVHDDDLMNRVLKLISPKSIYDMILVKQIADKYREEKINEGDKKEGSKRNIPDVINKSKIISALEKVFKNGVIKTGEWFDIKAGMWVELYGIWRFKIRVYTTMKSDKQFKIYKFSIYTGRRQGKKQ